MASDNDRPLSATTARNGIPALRAEAVRMAGALAASSAHLRIYQTKVDAVLSALAPDTAPFAAAPMTSLEISLDLDDFATTEILIGHLQRADPALSIDDCINEIFTVGLAALAHRLIPS